MKTADIAASYVRSSRLAYVQDGELDLVFAFHGGPTEIIFQVAKAGHPSDIFVSLAGMFAGVIPATHLVAVSEAWGGKFEGTEAPEHVERGTLQAMAEAGDRTVHTILLVTVVDLKHPGDSQVWGTDVDTGTEPEHFTSGEHEVAEGSMPDRILKAHAKGLELRPPVGLKWQDVAAIVASMGLIVGAVELRGGRPHDVWVATE